VIVFKNFKKDNFKTFFYLKKSLLAIFGELRGFMALKVCLKLTFVAVESWIVIRLVLV
jgi:hypothetical protein